MDTKNNRQNEGEVNGRLAIYLDCNDTPSYNDVFDAIIWIVPDITSLCEDTMTFWKQARGDHMMVSSMVSALILSYIVSLTIFGNNIGGVIFFGFDWLFSTLVTWYLIPQEWINNELPKYHFWRDLLT